MLFVKCYWKFFFLIKRGNIKLYNSFVVDSYYGKKLIIEIDPKKVTHYLPVEKTKKGISKRYETNFYSTGNWDNRVYPIEEHRKTKDMYELFSVCENNKSFAQTKAYKNHIYELETNNLNTKNEPIKEILNTKEKIDNYYKSNIKLFKEIRKNGFKLQDNVGGHWTQEIGVAIGPKGELYRYGNGYHRMAIAKYLKLPSIPVVIKKVHEDWYRNIEEVYNVDPLLNLDEFFKKNDVVNNSNLSSTY